MVAGERMATMGGGRDALNRFWLGLLAACMVLAGVGTYSVLATLSARADVAALEPQNVAREFYAMYLPQAGAGHAAQAYHASALITPRLVQAVDSLLADDGQPADPFLCARELPARVTLSPVHVGLDTAIYHLSGTYPSFSDERPLADVTLHLEEGHWQIAGIRCLDTAIGS